ncbi:LppU/SCO3897 family protein [Nocardia sp. NPDC003482]
MSFPPVPQPPSTANGIYCAHCGATPAVPVNFRAHRGLIFLMQFRTARGPFCRDCGLATFRRMTGDSLWQGWWGLLSFVINPITMLSNLPARSKVAALPPPIPGSPYQPMNPGAPLTRRPQMIGLLVPLALVGVIVAAAVTGGSSSGTNHTATAFTAGTTSTRHAPTTAPATRSSAPAPKSSGPSTAKAGDCVYNKHPHTGTDDDNPDVEVVACTDPRAEAEVLGRVPFASGQSMCETSYPDTDAYYEVTVTGSLGALNSYTLCLRTR